MTKDISLYLVGGAVRDYIRNREALTKDFDFSVEAPSFEAMCKYLEDYGFQIFLKSPEHLTARAKLPRRWTFAGFEMSGMTYDFVLCRRDGHYIDGRRPTKVYPGTLYDDLSRRDFCMNAIAIDKDRNIIDPFNGIADIKGERIVCVGGTERLEEDALRILRAMRFSIQLGFTMSNEIEDFLWRSDVPRMLEKVVVDRVRDELTKCFKVSGVETIKLLSQYPYILETVLEGKLWLKPTTESKK